MKTTILTFLTFLFVATALAQQSPIPLKDTSFNHTSGTNEISLTKNTEDNLYTLGLIWGFVKYYHPTVAKGEVNWDAELFQVLPSILKAKNANERDDSFVSWINKLGAVKAKKKTSLDTTNMKFGPDLGWIDSSGFSPQLLTLLHTIQYADRTGKNYYVSLKPGVRNTDFSNEEAYKNIQFPDAGFRVLSLYRYWNIIQYFSPYKNLIKEDWKNVLREFVPKIIDVKNETEYTLAMLEMIGRVHDTHANVWGNNAVLANYRGNRYAAVDLTFVENKAVVTGYYDDEKGAATGLKIGEIITGINGKSINDIIAEQLKYTPASNYSTQLRDLAPRLLRTNDSTINIEYMADGKTNTKVLQTFSSKEVNIYRKYQVKDTCFKLLGNNIAYINNGFVKKDYLPALWKDWANTKGVIIDDRNYPSEFVIFEVCRYLMREPVPFVKFSAPSIEEPGLFKIGQPLSAGKKNGYGYKGKVVILVNEETQSSAEYHAMAYRAFPGAIVIGSTTAGADGNVSHVRLPGGISTLFSGIGVYYPDGRETQQVGIVPDIVVQPTIADVKAGRDEVLEKAVQLIGN